MRLTAGAHTLSLSSRAGNFKPSDFGGDDSRELSFGIEWLDLRTTP
jgi:hypothetical protein